jgi:hypothetical protein
MARSVDGRFKTISFYIEGVKLDSFSLAEVAEYVADFAKMIGQEVEPRFESFRNGSARLCVKIPREHEYDVKTRGFLLLNGEAPEDALRAQERISRRLGMHKAKRATIRDSSNNKLIEIPIDRTPAVQSMPSLAKSGSLQGQIIRIGGKQETVPVDLQDVDGHIYSCKAKREIAKDLAKEIFGATIRVHGSGRWRRDDEGTWRTEDFMVHSFDILDDEPLDIVLSEIRTIKSKWQDIVDPLVEMNLIRSGQ